MVMHVHLHTYVNKEFPLELVSHCTEDRIRTGMSRNDVFQFLNISLRTILPIKLLQLSCCTIHALVL